FEELCRKWGMDKHVRSFTTWEQTCTHIMAFVLRLESLREVEATLSVARCTFADANANRSAYFFDELCTLVLRQIQWTARSRKVKRAIRELLAMDASECRVHGNLSRLPLWLHKKAKGKKIASMKFHAI